MDGAHDLGGRQGFGPVDVNEPEEPFHAPWEGRMWALARSAGQPDWTLDWWRHVRELIEPVDYLSRPYFDSWAQTYFAALIDSGVLTLAEAESGKAEGTKNPPPALSVADALDKATRSAHRFDRPVDTPPAFRVGDAVRAGRSAGRGHTRLPAYVRERAGTIHAHHAAHILPDKSARGIEAPEHLYSVAFAASELWPEAVESRDTVYLDLWESYLVPA